LEVSADPALGLVDSGADALTVVSAIEEGSVGMITSSLARMDPEKAGEWLLSHFESLPGDRQFPEGWLESLLEGSPDESRERSDFLETTTAERLSRRGGRETRSDMEAEEILSENHGSLVNE